MTFAALTTMAMLFGAGCAKPIAPLYYTRTPLDVTTANGLPKGRGLRVGVGVDLSVSPQPRGGRNAPAGLAAAEATAYLVAQQVAEAFIQHAREREAFANVNWVLPEDVGTLDCQLEIDLSYEESGNRQAHYCLGRLVANIYNGDHSQLLDRAVFFHEAMYTAKDSKQSHMTSTGEDARASLRSALFEELINFMTGSASVPATVAPSSRCCPKRSRLSLITDRGDPVVVRTNSRAKLMLFWT